MSKVSLNPGAYYGQGDPTWEDFEGTERALERAMVELNWWAAFADLGPDCNNAISLLCKIHNKLYERKKLIPPDQR